MKRWIHASSDEDWIIDLDFSKISDEQIDRDLKRFSQMELADEADYYDYMHHEGKYEDLDASVDLRRGYAGEEKMRHEWFQAANYPNLDPRRVESAFEDIDWCDLTAEDSELILENTETFPDLDKIKSVRYFNDAEQSWAEDNGFDGGYVVTYRNGVVYKYAWIFGESEEDVTYTDIP